MNHGPSQQCSKEEYKSRKCGATARYYASGLEKKNLARHSEMEKKTRQTEEEVRRQHQGMDRQGVRQVPEGSGEQEKMEETGCKIICGAPTILMVTA